MLPDFEADGNLPAGIHWAEGLTEVIDKFGYTEHRRRLLAGLSLALDNLRAAGCGTVYLNGSFVTSKEHPEDYDACWDVVGVDVARLDPIFFDFKDFRAAQAAQKAKYLGEFFPAQLQEGFNRVSFMEFFQTDKNTGARKGIVALDLRRLSS
jgi:RNAse (barnase) inhibitor barstar